MKNMNSREKVMRVFNRESCEAVMWTGHPNDKTIDIYAKAWGIEPSREAIFQYLQDDCRWVVADSGYCHPDGDPIFNPAWGKDRDTLSAEGCFAEVEEISELDAYPWPDIRYCDFTKVYEEIERYPDKMVFTGIWSPFFHIVADFFGMENYFIKMYEAPEIVHEVTKRVVDFYVAANNKFFDGLDDRADVMFFGNDLGTQLDLFIAPKQFNEFVLPYIKQLVAVGKSHGKKVMMHSCGSIYRVIPDLIEAGVDILHPIQARAAGMSAKDLEQYKDRLSFVGGIDAQTFFVNASPAEIEAEVARVRGILSPGFVVSPSHEEILPNVPPENVKAMATAAHKEF